MVSTFLRRPALATAPCLLLAALVTAHAQPPAAAAPRPDPLDPKAVVPAVRYESAFVLPMRPAHPPPIDWREANDNVARIGGWRAYAREAQQPEPARPPAPAAAAPAPAAAAPAPTRPGGHAGHGHHGGGQP